MPATYYPCSVKLPSRHVFFLWYTNGADGTVCESNRLVTFSSLKECVEYAEGRNFDLGAREATVYDLASIDDWIQHPEESPIDAPVLLDFWNLLEDFFRSRNTDSDSFQLDQDDLYEKLFYANNLPSITPPGERFDPDWTSDEKHRIAAILKQPLVEFHDSLLQ